MPGIFLIGFMASGKSQVAECLSKRLSMPSIDLDMHIENTAGQSVAVIFDEAGEAEFRRLESEALGAVIAEGNAVVATGGGCASTSDNLQRMKQAGRVVHLATELPTALSRAKSDQGERPLLNRPHEEIEKLYRDRASTYRRAHISVSTEGKSAERVAADIELALRAGDSLSELVSDNPTVVALQERSYPVVVESGALETLGKAIGLRIPGCTKLGLVSDERVSALYGERVLKSLESAGFEVVQATIPEGETSKEITVFESLSETLIEKGLDRKSAIVALGGGVVGDLAGFVAASLFRGINLVQVPTTLLAMTDSSIGGKTGINSQHGKNLIGAFWQPALVWIDPATLRTLAKRERVAAFGELLKYGLLDEAIWPMAAQCAQRIGTDEVGKPFVVDAALTALINSCAALKAAIVSADERESGLRATLNLGHTVAHAIEAAAGFGQVLHGEAVALGLLASCRVSSALGYCSPELESELSQILATAGLDVGLDTWLRPEVLEHMSVDKKRTGSRVRFVVVNKPGDVRLHEIGLAELNSLLLRD